MNLKINFLATSLLFLHVGCTSLNVNQPTGIFEIPEISDGESGTSMDLGVAPGVIYTATSCADCRPFKWDPSIGRQSIPMGRIRLPIPKNNLELGFGAYFLGLSGSMKYQFFGPHFLRAKKGDFSMAVVGKVSTSLESKKSGNSGNLFSSTGPWEGSINSTELAGSLIFGYRIYDQFLVYSGALYSSSAISARVKQGATSDGQHPEMESSHSNTLVRSGPVLGFLTNLNKRVSLHLEGAYLNTQTSQSNVNFNAEAVAAAFLRIDIDRSPAPMAN